MNTEGPKLHVHKPKKAQVKRFLEKQLKAMDGQSTSEPTTVSSSPAAASYKDRAGTGGGAASKPPEVPKESFARRFKFLWPMVLAVNLAIGGYVLFRTTKKDGGGVEEEGEADSVPSTTAISTTSALDKSSPSLPAVQPVKHEPIPENQQRELFKWMLGEMRKVKPKDAAEKKRIDEEKAFLKQLIRAKEIPKI